MNLRNILATTLAATALTAVPAQADHHTEPSEGMLSAENIMRGDVSDGGSQVARVKDLVLSPDGTEVEYVLFEQDTPYTISSARNGFVMWDNVNLAAGQPGDLQLRLENPGDAGGPDELALTRAQANTRLVSRLMDAQITFADGAVRPITDLVFDEGTGQVREFVVAFDTSGVFDNDERRIPAQFVRINESNGYSVVQPSDYGFTVWVL